MKHSVPTDFAVVKQTLFLIVTSFWLQNEHTKVLKNVGMTLRNRAYIHKLTI